MKSVAGRCRYCGRIMRVIYEEDNPDGYTEAQHETPACAKFERALQKWKPTRVGTVVVTPLDLTSDFRVHIETCERCRRFAKMDPPAVCTKAMQLIGEASRLTNQALYADNLKDTQN